MELPAEFTQRIRETFGDAGARWLAELPTLLAECEQRWGMTLGAPFPLSYNYVAPGTRADGAEIVLKAGVPHRELHTEIAALRHYDGRGVVQLIDADAEAGVMLLERLSPGETLDAAVEDDAHATAIAADLMRELWQKPPDMHDFPTVHEWSQALARVRLMFAGGTGPLPPDVFEMAESLFVDLSEASGPVVLLHGDLHHANILRAEREPWLAIDPKGVVGDRGFEVGAFLRNPMPDWPRDPGSAWPWQKGAADRLRRRVEIFAERLEIDPERIAGWGIAVSVLSACWSLEDHGTGWEHAIAVAEMLAGQEPSAIG